MPDEPVSTLANALVAVWGQVLLEGRPTVDLDGQRFEVTRTAKKGLRSVYFAIAGTKVEGIEQNPETRSRWAKLAQAGSKIMQFSVRGRYIANVCDGTLTRYPSWTSMELPD